MRAAGTGVSAWCAQIGTGVAQLQLPNLADLMDAVANSGNGAGSGNAAAAEQQSTLAFAAAVTAASEPLLLASASAAAPAAATPAALPSGGNATVRVVSRLAAALARCGAAPPASWLSALQTATLGALGSMPEEDVALLAWAVAKLVSLHRDAAGDDAAPAAADGSNVPRGVTPAWHAALLHVRTSSLRLQSW